MMTCHRVKKRLAQRFRDLIEGFGACEDHQLEHRIPLKAGTIRLQPSSAPIQIRLGGKRGKRLRLFPEFRFQNRGQGVPTGALLIEALKDEREDEKIAGFLRLCPGDSLVLGRQDYWQRQILDYPKSIAERHLRIQYSAKGLLLKSLAPRYETDLAPLPSDRGWSDPIAVRWKRLEELRGLLGGRFQALPKKEALELLQAVIAQMASEPRQALDARGHSGGVIGVPGDTIPFFVGDLHGRIDNLLVILTQNGFLEGLRSGTATLIILGDAIHPDEPGQEGEMISSMLIMDFIFRLILRFPGQVFYLRGNHDSFSKEISKGGVPQGALWESALERTRGTKYVQAMRELYDRLPYFALSKHFIACHAGPPTGKVSLETLINLRSHRKIAREVTHIRLGRPNSPSGYTQGDVKRLRRRLELDGKTPFLVGHTPLSSDDTLWLNAGGVPNHHVLFGAHPQLVGVIALVGKRLLPLRYPSEPLSRL